MTRSKRCSRCGCWLPLSAFWRQAEKPDGLRSACKECEQSQTRGEEVMQEPEFDVRPMLRAAGAMVARNGDPVPDLRGLDDMSADEINLIDQQDTRRTK